MKAITFVITIIFCCAVSNVSAKHGIYIEDIISLDTDSAIFEEHSLSKFADLDTLTADSAKKVLHIHDAFRFADAFAHTISAPIRWEGKDWAKAGGVIAGTAILTLVDKPVRSFWQNRDSKAWDAVERAGFHLGKPYASFILTGGFYVGGVVLNNEWMKETGVILGAAYLASGAVQTLMKTAIGRARPGTGVGPWAFDPMSPEAAYHSFPSGHIQVAMVSALVLAKRVNNPWLKSALYATGGLTLVSRMYSDSHWLSDMAFGAAISWFCTHAIVDRLEETRFTNPFKKKNTIQWSLAPTVYGVGLKGVF